VRERERVGSGGWWPRAGGKLVRVRGLTALCTPGPLPGERCERARVCVCVGGEGV